MHRCDACVRCRTYACCSRQQVTREHYNRARKTVHIPKTRPSRTVDLTRYQRRERPDRCCDTSLFSGSLQIKNSVCRSKTAQMGGKPSKLEQERRLRKKQVDRFISGLQNRLGGSPSPQRGNGHLLAPLDTSPLNVGDFSFHEQYARGTKTRRAQGRRAGTLKFIDTLIEARREDEWCGTLIVICFASVASVRLSSATAQDRCKS